MRDIELEFAAMLVFPNDSLTMTNAMLHMGRVSRAVDKFQCAQCVCPRLREIWPINIDRIRKVCAAFFSLTLLYVSSAALWSWTKNHCHGSRSSLDLTLIEVAVELSKWLSLVQPTSSPRQETKKTLHRMLHGLWVLIFALHSMNVRAQTALFSVSALEL